LKAETLAELFADRYSKKLIPEIQYVAKFNDGVLRNYSIDVGKLTHSTTSSQ